MGNQVGYTGIKFPFRFTGSGGVATSTTSMEDISHIEEEIIQALQVFQGEKILNPISGSKLNQVIFEPGDDTLGAYVVAYTREALEVLSDKIDVTDITPEWGEDWATLNIMITIFIKKYYMTDTVVVPYKLGGEN